jgi:serine protease Do
MRHTIHNLTLALTVAALAAPAAPAQDLRLEGDRSRNLKTNPQVLVAFRPVVATAALSTVRVYCDGEAVALGTVVRGDGYVLTKASELKPGKLTVHDFDGRDLAAKRVATHEAHDLAMLKVEAKDLPAVAWSPSNSAPVGNWVAAVGPGQDPVAVGVVSVAARNVPPPRFRPRPAPPAGSGYLGVYMEESDTGVKVREVTDGAPAGKAGMKAGDVVMSVNGQSVSSPDQLIGVVQKHKAGETVKLVVHRGETVLQLEVTLGKRPASLDFNRGEFQNRLGSELSEKRTGFPTILQHDGVIKPADCGGPLVDLDGRVIGLNIARAGRTESYAVPSEVIAPLVADLIAGKSTAAPAPVSRAAPQEPAEKVRAAREALRQAEEEKPANEAKVAAAKAALEKALAEEKAANEKKGDDEKK